jgi:hypothetical protein
VISDIELSQIKASNPCDVIAERMGVRLRRRAGRIVGPCPICSTNKSSPRSTKFEIKDGGDGWVCVNCGGGDVIKLVQLAQGQDFRGAIAWLGGPGEIDHAAVERRERERAAREARRQDVSERYRQSERKRLYAVWENAQPARGTAVENYLEIRRLALPQGARLAYVPQLPYFYGKELGEDGRQHARIIHRGPAMVAPITDNEGIFRGLSQTWIDLTQANGKAVISAPEPCEALPPRIFRGSTKAGHIHLLGSRKPTRLIIGEGIETTLSAWFALTSRGRDLTETGFWTALDLGNFGGRASDKVGRVPGPTPDLGSPAIILPASVVDVIMLGDGDSDRTLTECALRRASTRWQGEGRTVRVAWAPAGRDFNDLLRGGA